MSKSIFVDGNKIEVACLTGIAFRKEQITAIEEEITAINQAVSTINHVLYYEDGVGDGEGGADYVEETLERLRRSLWRKEARVCGLEWEVEKIENHLEDEALREGGEG